MTPYQSAEDVALRIVAAVDANPDLLTDAVADRYTDWLDLVRGAPAVPLWRGDCWTVSEADADLLDRGAFLVAGCDAWVDELAQAARRLGEALRAAGAPQLAELVYSTGEAATNLVETVDNVTDPGVGGGLALAWGELPLPVKAGAVVVVLAAVRSIFR